MAKLSILAGILFLQAIFQYCSPAEHTYTLQSFRRLDKEDRFLKIQWDVHTKAYNLSFTGLQTDPGAKFFVRTEEGISSTFPIIRPAGMPYYILAVEEGRLLVKNISDVTVDPNRNKYMFSTRRIYLNYSEGNNKGVTEEYYIIQSRAIPFMPRFIKSSRSGRVSLSVNWKNCGTWVRMQ